MPNKDEFATHPQPRTFAPSKEDVLQNLQYFFGAPVSPEKLKDYSEHHATTYHFPDAYAGSNTPEELAKMTRSQRWRAKNPEKYRASKQKSDKKAYEKNKTKIRADQAAYRQKNLVKVRAQTQRINKARLKTDPVFKLKCLMRTRIGNFMKYKGDKDGSTFKLIGCSPEHLRAHLGDQPGDTDHIFPLARYDAATEQHKMTNWRNLQRLTPKENSLKNDKLPTKAMAAKVPRELWPNGVTEDMLPDIYKGWKTSLNMN